MKVLILGAGISGLSAAWELQKRGAEVTVLEGSSRLGGWIEQPRTVRGEHVLGLIREMGLEVVWAAPGKRYIWHGGRLQSFSWRWAPGLVRGLLGSGGSEGDESVGEFARRRFGDLVAEEVLDPMVLGVYAGEMDRLSVRACFPFLVKGSLMRKILRKKQQLFTVKGGMGRLAEELGKRVPVVRDCPVTEIREDGVVAGGKFWTADWIASALPGQVLGKLTGLWSDFRAKSVWVVRLEFAQEVGEEEGFGYLVPTKEREELLGMVWDSKMFPDGGGAKMTAMVRAEATDPTGVALEALRRHLGVVDLPTLIEPLLAKEAIPQFEVGYEVRLGRFLQDVKKRFPRLKVVGNFLNGVSLDACVQKTKNITL